MQATSGLEGRMNATSGIDFGFKHTKRVLFGPFDIKKWLALGLIIFLESLVPGGFGGASFNFSDPFGSGSPAPGMREIVDTINESAAFVQSNLGIIVAVAIPVLLLLTVIFALIVWLGSRGQMMFIRAVAANDARLGINWHDTQQPAWSLFKFRIVLVAASTVVSLTVLLAVAWLIVRLAADRVLDWTQYLIAALPFLIVLMVFGIVVAIVDSLLRNFVAPLMMHLALPVMESWRKLFQLLQGNLGPLLVFFVIRFVIGVVLGLAAVIVTVVTCCIGALPVIHQTLMAPVYVFERAYSLYVLESFGPQFKMIQDETPPHATGPGFDNPGSMWSSGG